MRTARSVEEVPVGHSSKRLNHITFWRSRVSRHSSVFEDVWIFEKGNVRRGPRTVDFRTVVFEDGSRLTDPQHVKTLRWCKALIFSVVHAPANGFSKERSIMHVWRAVRNFIRWRRDLLPQDLTSALSNQFADHIADGLIEEPDTDSSTLSESDDDDDFSSDQLDITARGLRNLLMAPTLLWEQRKDIRRYGIEPPPEPPYDGASVYAKAESYRTRALGWWQPLPDEVARIALNSAAQMTLESSKDIIDHIDELYRIQREGKKAGLTEEKIRHAMGRAASAFNLPTPAGRSMRKRAAEVSADRPGSLEYIKVLAGHLSGACASILMMTAGMRSGELPPIRSGTDPVSKLPTCVRVAVSPSGLHHLYFLRSELSKVVPTPQEEDWLIGMQPIGSDGLPLTVRVLNVLNRLYARLREDHGTTALFPSPEFELFTKGDPGVLAALDFDMTSGDTIRSRISTFLRVHADFSKLPDSSAHSIEPGDLIKYRDTNGACIHSHQFRKTFANYTLAVDPGLLPAVQMQFKHLSVGMTDLGYWGSNRQQIEPVRSVQQQQTTLTLFEIATGRALPSGRMGKQLVDHIDQLHEMVRDHAPINAWKNIFVFRDAFNLTIWFSPHGKCLPLHRAEMSCHLDAGTRPDSIGTPNFSTRDATTCGGCKNFLIDSRHLAFWADRYAGYFRASNSKAARNRPDWRVLSERAAQSKAFLRSLGCSNDALAAIEKHGAAALFA
jgi:hypothetical protein